VWRAPGSTAKNLRAKQHGPKDPDANRVMMLDTTAKRFVAASATIRRWCVMLLASLFMITGVIDAVQHGDAVGKASAAEISAGPNDGDADGANGPILSFEHCHGCAPAAVEMPAETQARRAITGKIDPQPARSMTDHPFCCDPPPPKMLI
jgi:hypothetical protein